MQFVDLHAQQKRIRDKIEDNIKKVLDHGKYIMGPEIMELEEKLAHYVGTDYAVGVASGTDALLTNAYRAVNIPLSDLNIDLDRVAELLIGFGNPSQAGGEGRAYVDDISLLYPAGN